MWAIIGAIGGLAAGAVAGFGVALVLMSVTRQPGGGTFGMADVIVCVPVGAVVGLGLGLWWGLR